MEYKYVEITDSISIPVPKGLTPDEEANFLVSRIGFVNFEQLEAEAQETLQLLDEGKLTLFEATLDELERQTNEADGIVQ